jgi:prepilin-type N-terminal cleavage/methylation domain-containing protein
VAGFTLIELLVGMVVGALAGIAVVRLITAETGAQASRDAMGSARRVATGSLNLLTSELRMVEPGGGVEALAADFKSVTLRVPYALGLLCKYTAGSSTVSLLPSDSSLYFAPGFSGFAVLNNSTSYTYVTSGVTLTNSGTASNCTAAAVGISTLPAPGSVSSNAGRIVTLAGTVSPTPKPGQPVLLFRRIQYAFKASGLVPGKIGLWRKLVTPNSEQELAAPFDTTARFRYFVLNGSVAQNAIPGTLSDLRGVELQLDAQSDSMPRQTPSRTTVRTTADVFFHNRPD